MDNLTKNRIVESFYNRKLKNEYEQYNHPHYQQERRLLNAIKMGNEKEALRTLKAINQHKRATLATSSLRSLKNSIICSCTLFTRAGIEGGLHAESAYNLSDTFIMKIETLQAKEEIEELEILMVKTIISMLRETKTEGYAPLVLKAINYIEDNIFQSISLEDIANELTVNPSYLSSLFKKETNFTVSQYINFKKIEESKYFLIHTDLPILEISILFNYCNQSYYTALFKKFYGITPGKFRNLNQDV